MAKNQEPKGYKRAFKRATRIVGRTASLTKLVDKALTKVSLRRKSVKGVWGDFKAILRMVKLYVTGDYREVSAATLIIAVTSIVYFVNPLDLIPDFLLGIGFLDDATVTGYVLKQIRIEVDKFVQWETEQNLLTE